MSLPTDGVLYTVPPFVQSTQRGVPSHGGELLWHRYVDQHGRITWDHLRTVGTGWSGMNQVFDGRDGIVYFIEPVVEATVHLNRAANTPASGGRLMWARHVGHLDGTFRWVGPRPVGRGWAGFKQVFAAGGGVIYAIEPAVEGVRFDRPGTVIVSGGKLVWYRHLGHDDGTFRWEGPHEIASGWGGFTHVFAGSGGALYAVKPNGDLMWWHHAGQQTGAANLSQAHRVGTGWGIYEHVCYGGNGFIYGVEALRASATFNPTGGTGISGGRLIRWRHAGMADGRFDWEGPVTMDRLWSGSERVFADGADRVVVDRLPTLGRRFCTFKDPPGSPTLGPRSYGISKDTNQPRRMPLTWTLDPGATVSNIPVGGPPTGNTFTPPPPDMWSIISQAFAIWSTPAPAAPAGTSLALSFEYVQGHADLLFRSADLGPPAADGSYTAAWTIEHGTIIEFNSNPAVAFLPRTPAGGAAALGASSSMLNVATHEIGHALGLLHNTNPGSMMWPDNLGIETLGADDIQSIRALYGWQPQRPVQGIGTDSSPVVCACGGSVVLAWKGIDPDDSVWVCRSTDGINWTPQRAVPGTGTTDGPALAWDGKTLWLALRGIEDDDAVYWATSGDLGDNWSGVGQVPNAGSANGPAMTIFNGNPLLVWRGIPGDTGLYFNFWNNGWTTTGRIGGTGSTDRPTVCVDVNQRARIVWRGIEGDDALYTTVFTGTPSVPIWEPQQILQWIVVGNGGDGTTEIGVPGSLRGPSAINITRATDQETLLLWRGVKGDQGIYFTQGAAGTAGAAPIDWSTQAQIPGVGTTGRPSITVFKQRILIAWQGVEGDHTIYTAFN